MTIDDIFLKFDTGGPSDYYSFETFIFNLLKFHIEQQGKKLTLIENPIRNSDIYAEEGFDSFIGETLIDIKYNLFNIPPKIFIKQHTNKIIRLEKQLTFSNFLIISLRTVPDTAKSRYIEELLSINPELKVTIWGPKEIVRLVNKHKTKSVEIANNLFSLRLENVVTKEAGDWEKERDEKIDLLKESYERSQFSMFLGAGVSSSAGMPDWNTLLNSLFVSYLTQELNQQTNISDEDIKQIVERLNTIDEPSALMAARYLRKGLSKQTSEIKEFTKAITENLYKLRDTTKKLDSDLITAISNLCMPRRTGARVKTVITYNFDDLLERQLAEKSIQHHSIYTENEAFDPDELPIYHVHGFLPQNSVKYEGLEKSTLVFSEEGYHQIYTDAYHWSNLVQLANLRENNCLMIGLSMTDPNLRRLLDISARNIDRPRHYAFMKRLSIDNFAFSNNNNAKIQHVKNISGAEEFLNRHHKLNEEIMKELGVSIIWYASYDEIPEILNKINS
ncbi:MULTISPECIES: SIR2 family protein [Elizabethkingia]|uniref:SIR2 family protein n=1 Tax=Elizabethkingia TaxID=308865 RepID=UPI0021A53E13|nr:MULTISPECIES: SIR2 family protein [Elizabethkingia]MCT3686565.1 SIR2 family protein [Elizabethkingia anophelis]MCT3704604.1 SIR2 family protein [Elizabethkingia anophelis]MCT3711623.1 SIR2 family protein [Elizabethkingia anophelis]MCT3715988.1 SIR2 family protein [Elizabethkingia anophelis]MCT3729164.1 SIR2 family protein [Elizabethkingia anophelis]